MHRTSFLRVALWIAIMAAGHSFAAETRPNFLFLYTDDQRWDALSVVQQEQGERARFPWFQTPNMDRIAKEGVRFRNAFVTLSLCAPSRATFLTGRYNHFNGIASNFRPFPTNNVTHATLLRAAGYTTAYVGKWHMDSQRERPGFDFHASFIGHARYIDPPFIVDGKDVATKGWIDDISTDYAIEFLKKQKDSAKPWSLIVGFKSPHGPFEPPARWADKFPDGYAKVVPNLDVTPPFPGPINRGELPPEAKDPNGKLKVNLNYFRCIAAVDENVGRLLKALDELGLADDTMIVYASDNGFYLGEHRLADKRSAYEESLRVPLLVRYPRLGVKGRLVDEMVINLDLAPTFLDYAGVSAPKEMQGRSWRPLLEGKPANWRTSFFYEYFWEQQRANPTPTHTAVRTTTAKLIKYQDHDDWTELFDLARDPYERKNLFNDPSAAALRSELEAEYEKQRLAVGYIVPSYAEDPSRKPLVQAARPLNSMVLEYRFEKDDGDRIVDSSTRNHHGTNSGTTSLAGGGRRFDGTNYINVPKTATLDPAVTSWIVTVQLKAEQPDGIILAQGGNLNGYCLSLEKGRPTFTVTANRERSTVSAPQNIVGQRATLVASWGDGKLRLAVNGPTSIEAPLKTAIAKQPNDALQIGTDLNSKVLDATRPGFRGVVYYVGLYSGETK
jgi:arylsulfatase A-like enzyme